MNYFPQSTHVRNLFLTVVTLYTAMLLLSGCNEDEDRAASQKAAVEWAQENKIESTITCRYPNPYVCDVIPKDPRPNIVLYCNKFCRLAIQ